MNHPNNPFIGNYISVNGQLTNGEDFGFSDFNPNNAVYEVLRVMEGKSLFLEDHYYRFVNSIKFQKQQLPFSLEKTGQSIVQLCRMNSTTFGNVKLFFYVSTRKTKISQPKLVIGLIPHKYPTSGELRLGIVLRSLQLERPNPNAKIVHQDVNERVNKLILETGADEILLVNPEGIMTEGSKSNIFFVAGNKIITAEQNLVLAGITRAKIIEICHHSGINIREEKPKLKDLNQFEAAFITGTSPKVMPVRQIDSYNFDTSHPVITKLQKEYDKMIAEYLGRN
jgi:branched-chain amino acid aminotransferase